MRFPPLGEVSPSPLSLSFGHSALGEGSLFKLFSPCSSKLMFLRSGGGVRSADDAAMPLLLESDDEITDVIDNGLLWVITDANFDVSDAAAAAVVVAIDKFCGCCDVEKEVGGHRLVCGGDESTTASCTATDDVIRVCKGAGVVVGQPPVVIPPPRSFSQEVSISPS